MPLHDTSYKHYDGIHLGVWNRRWVIACNGLKGCLQNRWMRYLVFLCWVPALFTTTLMFLVGQLLVSDSIVVEWVGQFNQELQMGARFLTSWLEQHPEISVRTTQNLLFFYFAIILLPLSIFALGIALPRLITRDLASNAIVIYSSKAVSRTDYFLGKFTTAFGLLTLTWLGPIIATWLMGNLLAPDWRFFWHSRVAIGHVFVFVIIGMSVLSLLALGVSALSDNAIVTPAIWFMWWIFGGVMAPIAHHTQPWLRHLSFNYNLNQLAITVFRPGDELKTWQESIRAFGANLSPDPKLEAALAAWYSPAIWGALLALVIMLALAVFVFNRRVKPE